MGLWTRLSPAFAPCWWPCTSIDKRSFEQSEACRESIETLFNGELTVRTELLNRFVSCLLERIAAAANEIDHRQGKGAVNAIVPALRLPS